MSDQEIVNILRDRLAVMEEQIRFSCSQVNRSRSEVQLVAVTKSVSARVTGLLPSLGEIHLGENRPQTLWAKAAELSTLGIRWHMIGHLQRNKVERTLPLCEMIHSVDSIRLLETIDSESRKQNRTTRCLLEVNVSGEESKHGFSPSEVLLLAEKIASFSSVEVQGLMTMAPADDNPETARPHFEKLREIRTTLQSQWGDLGQRLRHLSMGMSGDFQVAIESGATLIRVGSTLFNGLE